MLLQRERPSAPSCALIPPRRNLADRTLSALAFALMLSSWAVGYVAVVPPEQHVRHGGARVAVAQVVR